MFFQAILIGLGLLFLALFFTYWHRVSNRTSSTPSIERLPEANDFIQVMSLSNKEHLHKCGHRNLSYFSINFWGEHLSFKNSVFCFNCIIKELKIGTIRCYDCNLPIFVGDPVALWKSNGIGSHKDVVVIAGQSVCCLRPLCSPSFGAFVGHWNGQGIDYYFESENSVAGETMATGKPQSVEIT